MYGLFNLFYKCIVADVNAYKHIVIEHVEERAVLHRMDNDALCLVIVDFDITLKCGFNLTAFKVY